MGLPYLLGTRDQGQCQEHTTKETTTTEQTGREASAGWPGAPLLDTWRDPNLAVPETEIPSVCHSQAETNYSRFLSD